MQLLRRTNVVDDEGDDVLRVLAAELGQLLRHVLDLEAVADDGQGTILERVLDLRDPVFPGAFISLRFGALNLVLNG